MMLQLQLQVQWNGSSAVQWVAVVHAWVGGCICGCVAMPAASERCI